MKLRSQQIGATNWRFISTWPVGLGARQKSDESCRPQLGSAFPEVLEAPTKLGTAESDDGVGAVDGPMHPRAFKTCADTEPLWISGPPSA